MGPMFCWQMIWYGIAISTAFRLHVVSAWQQNKRNNNYSYAYVSRINFNQIFLFQRMKLIFLLVFFIAGNLYFPTCPFLASFMYSSHENNARKILFGPQVQFGSQLYGYIVFLLASTTQKLWNTTAKLIINKQTQLLFVLYLPLIYPQQVTKI